MRVIVCGGLLVLSLLGCMDNAEQQCKANGGTYAFQRTDLMLILIDGQPHWVPYDIYGCVRVVEGEA